jgi:mannitol/fructose-specific phosphotransferase system IIA component (Ntr-type)
LEVVKIASVSQLECQDVESIDLILSTIPLHHVKPVLHVSPLLTQTDIRRIELLINALEVPKIERSLFHEDLIEHQALYANREDAIRSLGDKLFSGGYVHSDFTEHVLAREAVYTTEIGNGVAIPHSVPDDVLHTRIAVAILKKPILWQEAYVDVIFLMAISNLNVKRVISTLRNFYKMLDSDTFLDALRQCKDQFEIKERLDAGCLFKEEQT